MTRALSGWHGAHLGFLSAWAFLVAAESVLEILGHFRPSFAKAVARSHYWIDLIVEIPLLIGVLVSGIALLPPAARGIDLTVKIACAWVAVSFNLSCVFLVVRRWHREKQGLKTLSLSRWIQRSILGLPFALAAFWIGAKRMGWV